MIIKVKPSNGIDYISEDAVHEAWRSGQDFIVLDVSGHSSLNGWRAMRGDMAKHRRINKAEADGLEGTTVSIAWRYGTRETDAPT